jgi:hypothetical protein
VPEASAPNKNDVTGIDDYRDAKIREFEYAVSKGSKGKYNVPPAMQGLLVEMETCRHLVPVQGDPWPVTRVVLQRLTSESSKYLPL